MESNDNASTIEASFKETMKEINNGDHSRIENHGFFPPKGSPTSDKFVSSLSLSLMVLFFVMLRFAAGPFLNPSVSSETILAIYMYFIFWSERSKILILFSFFLRQG